MINIFVMRQSLWFQRKLYTFLSRKLHNFPSNPNINLVLGLVPLLQTVHAQKEEKNSRILENTQKEEQNNTVVNKTVEHSSSLREPENKLNLQDTVKDERTGWERVCAVYERDEFGNVSKELGAVLQSTFYAAFLGLIFGGANQSRTAYIDFMERNQASIFESPFDAKRRLQNHVTMHFMKGGFRWAVKITSFTGGFMLFLITMGAYRGYYSILDYTLSGVVIGSVLKFRVGPPAAVFGGTVGGLLGAFAGTMTNILLSFQGSSLDDMIAFQYEIDQRRHGMFKEIVKKSAEGHIQANTLELIKGNDEKKIENPTI